MNWLDIFKSIDRSPKRQEPMYAQIVELLQSMIRSGQLPVNVKLPTNRELSRLLTIDRSTVARAYLELERLGLIDSHVGRGTFVTAQAPRLGKPGEAPAARAPMVWSDRFSRSSQTAFAMLNRHLMQPPAADKLISFAGGIPTQEFFPAAEFQEIVAHLNRRGRSAEMFEYSPPEGHPGLREGVRRHLAGQGIEATDEEILILSGSQQGIDLVTRALVDPGDLVLIEEPTYFWANLNFSASQARCLPVPADADGLRVDALESLLERHSAKLLYLMPTFQNPTGSTLSLERRHRLIELASRFQLPVLEDNFVGDLRYEGAPLPSLKELDKSGSLVIHQGTFSKALCPGLRLGWLVAPSEVMARLLLAKRSCDLSTNSMAQAVMAEYLRRGRYGHHLEHVRAAYRLRRDAMCASLARHLGGQVRFFKPDGGMFVWVRLASGLSARELLAFAEREGVTFSPGDMFFINGAQQEFCRLSFIQTDERAIGYGVERLGHALSAYQSQKRRAGRSDWTPAERASETALI